MNWQGRTKEKSNLYREQMRRRIGIRKESAADQDLEQNESTAQLMRCLVNEDRMELVSFESSLTLADGINGISLRKLEKNGC